jgi:hypothetical protein
MVGGSLAAVSADVATETNLESTVDCLAAVAVFALSRLLAAILILLLLAAVHFDCKQPAKRWRGRKERVNSGSGSREQRAAVVRCVDEIARQKHRRPAVAADDAKGVRAAGGQQQGVAR